MTALALGVEIDPLLGRVRLCPGCDEWWPDDDEFYQVGAPVCRACVSERYERRRRQVADAVRRLRSRRARRVE